ncbi:serine hydrolase [Sciscionella sediminilitoris]|uniref:serine hydrolase n=1 Tax=Sciscionella sediminilitoris TaxID=1445613 RepID=UPI00055B6AFD|nr:serine hydrolase [Sciscionella sp. SE31]
MSTEFDRLDTAVRAIERRGPETLAVAVHAPGEGRYGHHERTELPLASAGKLALLAELGRALEQGELTESTPVPIEPGDRCGGTGLLQHLAAGSYSLGDLALFTASVSDNIATNALLRVLGIEAVNRTADRLGLTATRLLDRIRDVRGPGTAPTFALGTAADLALLAARVAENGFPGAARVLRWMRTNTDHDLVPALLPHDPYQERPSPGIIWIANKTGTDDGVRADVGVMHSANRIAYAVLAVGEPGTEPGLVASARQAGLAIARHAAGWVG